MVPLSFLEQREVWYAHGSKYEMKTNGKDYIFFIDT
jgi:hypothetical protein